MTTLVAASQGDLRNNYRTFFNSNLADTAAGLIVHYSALVHGRLNDITRLALYTAMTTPVQQERGDQDHPPCDS